MKPMLAVGLVATILLVCETAGGQPADREIVKAELLADASAVKPGGSFTVAVRLTLEPGWHVYWINPGDSGVPTKVKFDAPNGFELGEVRFPVPVKFDQPGEAIGYGYEREVLLTAKVTAPATLGNLSEVTIRAEADWLACKDVCLPDRAKLAITLPVSQQPAPAHEPVFKKWFGHFPLSKDPAITRATWERGAKAGTFTYTVEWAKGPRDVDLYPRADEAIEVEKIHVATEGNTTRVTVNARILPGQKPEAETLPGLLVYTDAAGERRGMEVAIPVGTLTSAAP